MIQELFHKISYLSRLEGIELYLVGGFVRNLLQGEGREALDIDFIVKGKDPFLFLQKLTDELQASLVVMDKKNQVYRVVVRVKNSQRYLDFSVMQGENLEEDLNRRDFTINSMALKLEDFLNSPLDREKIIDPWGGIQDLQKGIIREVSSRVFEDDPLRLLRGVRFCAQLRFHLEYNTLINIKSNNHLIKEVARERIREELWKILDEEDSYPWIFLLEEDLGLLNQLFPQVNHMRLTEQNIYHGENVWQHCLRTYRFIEGFILEPPFKKDISKELQNRLEEEIIPGRKRKNLLKFFTLFHDAGKVYTKKVWEGGRITFYGHEKAGIEVIEGMAKGLRLSTPEINILKNLMRHHMRPLFLHLTKNLKPKTCYKFFKKVGEESPEVLFHSAADFISKREAKGQGEEEYEFYREFLQKIMEKYFFEKDKFVNPPPLVNGRDLMRDLGIKASPALGYLLDKISEAQAEGRLKSREEALEFASTLTKEKKFINRFGKIT